MRDKLVQGCMRMKQLGYANGHSRQSLASDEVHNEIIKTTCDKCQWNELVVDWASGNSEIAIKDGFLHWRNTGSDNVRKVSFL